MHDEQSNYCLVHNAVVLRAAGGIGIKNNIEYSGEQEFTLNSRSLANDMGMRCGFQCVKLARHRQRAHTSKYAIQSNKIDERYLALYIFGSFSPYFNFSKIKRAVCLQLCWVLKFGTLHMRWFFSTPHHSNFQIRLPECERKMIHESFDCVQQYTLNLNQWLSIQTEIKCLLENFRKF